MREWGALAIAHWFMAWFSPSFFLSRYLSRGDGSLLVIGACVTVISALFFRLCKKRYLDIREDIKAIKDWEDAYEAEMKINRKALDALKELREQGDVYAYLRLQEEIRKEEAIRKRNWTAKWGEFERHKGLSHQPFIDF